MSDEHSTSSSILAQSEQSSTVADSSNRPAPAPLTAIERRILGVLMEKARTTPDVYPLSLSGLVTGCNQKSNRHPLMNLTSERVEDALIAMRQKQLVAEVHSGGRVPKYRHYAYDYLGVKGVEAAVMTELLLRGEQTAGELRTRASRFDAIADLDSMHQILERLIEKGLVVALTPAGRGQMFSHNLYESDELERLQQSVGERGFETESPETAAAPTRISAASQDVGRLQAQLQELQCQVDELRSRIEALES